jgi:SAM-dependent methyltransferase
MNDVKQEVREFYDQVGWSQVGEQAGQALYQNARYEDLRPVSAEYLHRCHLRVGAQLAPTGDLLLDAGSGPIQYVEYLSYSQGYKYRVCADISITALEEARRKLGERGLYVVCDIANLPFKPDAFDGVVSLHTIHHLPGGEHLKAYGELHRVLKPGRSAAVVNGWPDSPLMQKWEPLVKLAARFSRQKRTVETQDFASLPGGQEPAPRKKGLDRQGNLKGTFTERHGPEWIKTELAASLPDGSTVEIRVWRSVSVRFLRKLIHPRLGGKFWLRLLYALEQRNPHEYGEQGQYPLIVLRKHG